MATAPKVQVLYRRTTDIFFGFLPLLKTEAKSYNLYSAPSATGVYTLLRSGIQNEVDKNYKNKVTILVKDSEIPIPFNVRYFFKLTFVDSLSIESDINLSPVTTIYPPDVDLHFEAEEQEANNHNFGWVEKNQRWEKILINEDGKLVVDASVDIGDISLGNVKIAARPDGTTVEYVLVDNQRRVVVSQDPTAYTRIRDFESHISVLPNVETIVLSYANAQAFYIDKLVCSGSADAKFNLKINGTTIETLRNSWNNRNVTFDFTDRAFNVSGGTTVTVTATHTEKTGQDYEASFFGFTYTY